MATLLNSSFLAACRGERPARTPVWLMRQAGRYMPEYRAVRRELSFLELCRSPERCAEVTLQPIDYLDVDAAILFSDILVVFDAMDVVVEFRPGPTITTPVRTHDDIAKLRFGDPDAELGYVFDAVAACKRALANRVPLIGFCGAPLTTLSYLIEGGSSRDFEHTKRLMFSEPAVFGRLLESMTDLLAKYLLGQVRAGADAIQIFDSWAAAVTPRDYRTHILPHVRQLIDRVRTAGVPVIMFARGNAALLEQIATTEADVIGIDWSIELDDAIRQIGPGRVVQGNLDPMVLLSNPDTIRRRVLDVLEAGRHAKAHIFNLGHGISRHTEPALAKLMVETVHAS
ncbi:MAG: uroporphyrinogen decarboxylase [Myxococcales bacterium FL481]|nr:MAG: uroporphyrinogen decarboxylase [Myxococcales bacterium FL481]